MRTPADLLKAANEAEALARVVSYGKDREWLMAKAAELRCLATRAQEVAKRDGKPASRGGSGIG